MWRKTPGLSPTLLRDPSNSIPRVSAVDTTGTDRSDYVVVLLTGLDGRVNIRNCRDDREVPLRVWVATNRRAVHIVTGHGGVGSPGQLHRMQVCFSALGTYGVTRGK